MTIFEFAAVVVVGMADLVKVSDWDSKLWVNQKSAFNFVYMNFKSEFLKHFN